MGNSSENFNLYPFLSVYNFHTNKVKQTLEVLDAERSLFSAELNYTQPRGLLFNALINIYKAMGGGCIAAG